MIANKTNRRLLERIYNGETLQDLLRPIDTNGEVIREEITQGCEYKQSLRSGHLFERLYELVFLSGVVEGYEDYKVLEGNLAVTGEKVHRTFNKFLYDNINIGCRNGCVDVAIEKEDMYILFSAKYYKTEHSLGDYDVAQIYTDRDINYGYLKDKSKIGLLLRNKEEFEKKYLSSRNKAIKGALLDPIVFDEKDLERYLLLFRYKYPTLVVLARHLASIKPPLVLRFHQALIARAKASNSSKRQILGAVPRSGKSYICAGEILYLYEKDKNIRVLIMTCRPNETASQFLDDIFHRYRDFEDFEITHLGHDDKRPGVERPGVERPGVERPGVERPGVERPERDSPCIHFSSKQHLEKTYKDNEEKYDVIFFDESHEGGSTPLTEAIIASYSHSQTRLTFITATYHKPAVLWSIKGNDIYTWTIQHIEAMKRLDLSNIRRDYGQLTDEVVRMYDKESLKRYYLSFPKLSILTSRYNKEYTDLVLAFNKKCENDPSSGYGYSMKALFSLERDGTFKNKLEVKKLVEIITGSGLERKESFFTRISKRYNDDHTLKGNTGILIFLPFGEDLRVKPVSNALKRVLEEDRIAKRYEIIEACEIKSNLKGQIVRRHREAIARGLEGSIILAGKKLSVGVSLDFVRIVCLLTHFSNDATIVQMMWRSMTEAKNKKYGYVIDLDPQRTLTCCVSQLCPSEKTVQENLRELVGNVINFDSDFLEEGKTNDEVLAQLTDIWMTGKKKGKIAEIRELLMYIDISDETLKMTSPKDPGFKEKTVKVREHEEGDFEINDGLEYKGDSKEEDEMTEDDGEEAYICFTDEEVAEALANGLIDISSAVIPKKKVPPPPKESSLEEKRRLWKDIFSIAIPYYVFLDKTGNTDICQMEISHSALTGLIERINRCYGTNLDINSISRILQMNRDSVNEVVVPIRDVMVSIKDKNELLLFLQSLLVPRELEKKKFGEVFTPVGVIEDMLDLLPKEIWEDEKATFLEPTNGIGNFIICIYYRLMEGLKEKIKDEKERERHILEKMIYTGEINRSNCEVYKRIIDPDEKYHTNIFCGDTLKIDLLQEFKLQKVDVIVGNPPYSTDPSNPGTVPLYNRFIEKYIDKCKYFSMIVPSRWFGGGKGLDGFRKMMLSRRDIQTIKHYAKSKDIFPNVDIEGGISYFLKASDHKGNCIFNGIDISLSNFDVIVEPQYISIVTKMAKYTSLETLYMTSQKYGIRTNDSRLMTTEEKGSIPCYVSLKKSTNRLSYIMEDLIPENKLVKTWKVLTARANGKAKCFGYMGVSDPESVYTDSYIAFKTGSERESLNLISYLRCKLPNFLLGMRKITQDISSKTVKWIPLVSLDKEWNDQNIYKYFDLSEQEIAIIESYSQKKVSVEEKKELPSGDLPTTVTGLRKLATEYKIVGRSKMNKEELTIALKKKMNL